MIPTSRSRMSIMFSLVAFVTVIGSFMFVGSSGNIFHAKAAKADSDKEPFCVQKQICADANDYGEYYVGHDEPSLLFYSNKPDSGNSYVSRLTLPKDPPKAASVRPVITGEAWCGRPPKIPLALAQNRVTARIKLQ